MAAFTLTSSFPMPSNLRLVYWNINSGWLVKRQSSAISIYFEQDSPIDLIVIAEPWLLPSELGLAQADGWTLFASLHPVSSTNLLPSHYGGVLLYIRDSLLHCFSLIELYNDSFTDIIVFSFVDVVFICCYLPPTTSRVFSLPPPSPLEELESLILRYVHGKLVVVGDLNAAMGVFRRFDTDPFVFDARGRRLLRLIEDNGLMIVNGTEERNTGYTFLRGTSMSCLDYVICNREDGDVVTMELCPFSEFSDHRPLDVIVSIEMEMQQLAEAWDELDLDAPPPLLDPLPMDIVVADFVKRSLEKQKRRTYGQLGFPTVRHVVNSLVFATNEENWASVSDVRRRMRNLLLDPLFISSSILRLQYQSLKSTLSRARRKRKRENRSRLMDYLATVKGSARYWEFVRWIFDGPPPPTKGPASLIVLGMKKALTEVTVDSTDSRLFVTMAEALRMGPQQICPLLDEPFTGAEIFEEIDRMQVSCNGGDGLSVSNLRALDVDDIADLFLEIQVSLSPPLSWSQACVVPVPKKDPLDFRPISILPRLRRLYTAVLARRLYQWAEDYAVLQPHQNGFRPNHRTSDNVFILHHLIQKSLAV